MAFNWSLSDSKSPKSSGFMLIFWPTSTILNFVGLHFSPYFQVLQSLHQAFCNSNERTDYNRIFIFIIIPLVNFVHQRYLIVINCRLSKGKSLQVSRALPSMLTDRKISVVWGVSTYPMDFWVSSPFTYNLGIVPRPPITYGIMHFTTWDFFYQHHSLHLFSQQRKVKVFHWSLRILLSILTDLKNTVVWMVSSRLPISKLSNSLTRYFKLFQVRP